MRGLLLFRFVGIQYLSSGLVECPTQIFCGYTQKITMKADISKVLSNSDNWKLREKLAKEFPTPEFKLKSELKAPLLTKNYSAVGIAFDYVLCKHIISLNENNHESDLDYVDIDDFSGLADYILYYPMDILPTSLQSKESEKLDSLEYFNKNLLFPWSPIKSVNGKVIERQISYKKEILTNELLLEKFKRYKEFLIEEHSNWSEFQEIKSKWSESRNIFDDRSEKQKVHPAERHDINDVKDIIALHSLIDNKLFVTKQKCYIHPKFGEASARVGAKADLIIGNTLIDIKTTIKNGLSRSYFNQIICYYILSLIGGVNGKAEEKPIENIGIYFARHGTLWTLPVSQLGDEQKFENFRKWFISFLRRKNIADLRGIYKQPKISSL
jgi:hypothetical protein